MRFTFRKAERLKSVQTINELYKSGISGFIRPFRYSYLVSKSEVDNHPVKILIAVSKKRLNKATDRNLVRRRIREAYRLNRHIISETLNNENLNLALIITYVGEGVEKWEVIEKKIVILLRDISKRLNKPQKP